MKQSGFTLIEIMIVVVIIGILAAIATVSYNGYVARAQVAEVLTMISPYKLKLIENYSAEQSCVDLNTALNESISTKYIASSEITDVAGTCSVVFTFKSTDVTLGLRSKQIYFNIPDGLNGAWNCQSDDISQRNLPATCRGI
ncbi:pilin [Acinetobacter sp. YH12128]|uniref:pilin n=1 Tax=Acinetobacter sp. YH12128 TaxID=2601113 RepID=UPI0015D1B733|nr:pilin [Acinetobacter sp. YH12128]